MRFTFQIGDEEKCCVEFYRNHFSGRMYVIIDGEELSLRSPWSLSTHFTFNLVKRYEFTAGKKEERQIMIEHRRPLFVAGFRWHNYAVYVDSELLEEHYGF